MNFNFEKMSFKYKKMNFTYMYKKMNFKYLKIACFFLIIENEFQILELLFLIFEIHFLIFENHFLILERSIYCLCIKSAPFFGNLKKFPETKNNSRFYILKLFFLLHYNRISCPVTSLLNIALQSWCILFKIQKNRCFLAKSVLSFA